MSAEAAANVPKEPIDPREGRAALLTFATAVVCGLFAVIGGLALAVQLINIDAGATSVVQFLLKLGCAAGLAWAIAFVHEAIRDPHDSLRARITWASIFTAIVIGGLFEVYVMSFDEVIEYLGSLSNDATIASARVKYALMGNIPDRGPLAFGLLTVVWSLSAVALAVLLSLIPFDQKEDSASVSSCAKHGFGASLLTLVFAFILVLAIRIFHVFAQLVFHYAQWKENFDAFHESLKNLPGIAGFAAWIATLVVKHVTDLWGTQWWAPLLTLSLMTAAIVWMATKLDGDNVIFVAIFGASVLVYVGFLLTILAPIFTWSLITTPLSVWLSFVVPGVVLGALVPILRDPSEKRRLWVVLAVAVGVLLAAIGWIRGEQGFAWWVLVGAFVLFVFVVNSQLAERGAWPILAVCAALLVGVLNVMFQATFSGVRQQLVVEVLPMKGKDELTEAHKECNKKNAPKSKKPSRSASATDRLGTFPSLGGEGLGKTDGLGIRPGSRAQEALDDLKPKSDTKIRTDAPPKPKSLLDGLLIGDDPLLKKPDTARDTPSTFDPKPNADPTKQGILEPDSTKFPALELKQPLDLSRKPGDRSTEPGNGATPVQPPSGAGSKLPRIPVDPRILDSTPTRVTIGAEPLHPNYQKPAAKPPEPDPCDIHHDWVWPHDAGASRLLELSLASSLGFWITIAILAAWSMVGASDDNAGEDKP
ncbi:MAG: hypothetical protein MI757_15965 [Pirellulales bacterium]|nr:hypothetical protein [Pirellulales bacterium]